MHPYKPKYTRCLCPVQGSAFFFFFFWGGGGGGEARNMGQTSMTFSKTKKVFEKIGRAYPPISDWNLQDILIQVCQACPVSEIKGAPCT